jgi:hypothetical protein
VSCAAWSERSSHPPHFSWALLIGSSANALHVGESLRGSQYFDNCPTVILSLSERLTYFNRPAVLVPASSESILP